MSDKHLDRPLLGPAKECGSLPGETWPPNSREMTELNVEGFQPPGSVVQGGEAIGQGGESVGSGGPIGMIRTPTGRRWFSWWNRRKNSRKRKKTNPTWHG